MSEVEVLFAYLARHDRMASSAHHSETGNLTQARDRGDLYTGEIAATRRLHSHSNASRWGFLGR